MFVAPTTTYQPLDAQRVGLQLHVLDGPLPIVSLSKLLDRPVALLPSHSSHLLPDVHSLSRKTLKDQTGEQKVLDIEGTNCS
mmetsp:Transcript_10915/g.16660  ORF Transcript_10915/g.16660 Transcript_10915/m.16660 type:complete len:82 (-) Transcript_10915:332-577(-)